MTDVDALEQQLEDLLAVLEVLGLAAERACLIADGVHQMIRIEPAGVVARVATLFPGDLPERRRSRLANELKVARQLAAGGVGTVLPAEPAGPHPLTDTWFTLWEYRSPQVDGAAVAPPRLWEAIERFRTVMGQHLPAVAPGQRPVLCRLRPWLEAAELVRRLGDTSWFAGPDLVRLVQAYGALNRPLTSLDLVPAHGDAHQGNLLVASDGTLLWLDFEDVSLMPRYWDAACIVARARLLGLGEEDAQWIEQAVRNQLPVDCVRDEWQTVLLARAVQITLVGRFFEAYGHEEAWVTQARISGALDMLDEFGGANAYRGWDTGDLA